MHIILSNNQGFNYCFALLDVLIYRKREYELNGNICKQAGKRL